MTYRRIVIASVAKQSSVAPLDCFATLAMTEWVNLMSSHSRNGEWASDLKGCRPIHQAEGLWTSGVEHVRLSACPGGVNQSA